MNPTGQHFQDLAPVDQLGYCTVRIEGTNGDGEIFTGTGFHYNITSTPSLTAPIIVTNKHVVKGMQQLRFLLTAKGPDGLPINTEHIPITIRDSVDHFMYHPDPLVDLCAIPLQPILAIAAKDKQELYYRSFDSTMLPTNLKSSELGAHEDILMVGYPNGLWDNVNNLPIVRRGMTATHPCINFQGRNEFVIDAACFPGSSGSPVFIHNPGGYHTKNGIRISDYRLLLIGVLYGGPQYLADGTIEIVTVPTTKMPVPRISIPTNLGYVIHASRLRELEEVFDLPSRRNELVASGVILE